ncbi:hypothetical protein M430DRAFT_34492 [Amorphotheca resinae ATCC 22711]|jgi:hypothetical protein|uniref:Uncharacterized protein n=1 Tax=Amorphotheca resinae ATCC 22711 TaxID=857342 RepID=A0A2T3B383_AMORE|nr:hypothetical protein M430DRAFT_34492 [Amorphotheca resinae ATCC 22711]PSS20114.1 hypothetical protein M430DRAFT_34492 [Amorphotheca resinae ATCC 22711]
MRTPSPVPQMGLELFLYTMVRTVMIVCILGDVDWIVGRRIRSRALLSSSFREVLFPVISSSRIPVCPLSLTRDPVECH